MSTATPTKPVLRPPIFNMRACVSDNFDGIFSIIFQESPGAHVDGIEFSRVFALA